MFLNEVVKHKKVFLNKLKNQWLANVCIYIYIYIYIYKYQNIILFRPAGTFFDIYCHLKCSNSTMK